MFFQVLEKSKILLYTKHEGDFVRKKDLFEQNTVLFNRLQSVTAELEKYKKLYDENIKEINALRRELANIEIEKAKDDDLTNAESVLKEVVPEQQSNTLADVVIDGSMEYGAKIIGKIILEGTRISNDVAQSPNEYSKDIINLVLGKTEVCKSQIYDICKGDFAEDIMRQKVDEVYKDAVDYFNSLNNQV